MSVCGETVTTHEERGVSITFFQYRRNWCAALVTCGDDQFYSRGRNWGEVRKRLAVFAAGHGNVLRAFQRGKKPNTSVAYQVQLARESRWDELVGEAG